jgi:hypothetical protein
MSCKSGRNRKQPPAKRHGWVRFWQSIQANLAVTISIIIAAGFAVFTGLSWAD